jgi:serine/threonine protein kinase
VGSSPLRARGNANSMRMIEPNQVVKERAAAVSSVADLVVAGTYRVGRLLGSGGMGEVWEAEHVRLGRPVAIKFLRASALADPASAERFRREARRAAAVRSERVVRVFDYGQLGDGTPYLVMERLCGEDLRNLLGREGALPVRRAVQLALDVCRGLSAVHAAGLVHRDLKPANLFVEQAEDGTERCIILDFGVAKAMATETTRPGALIGTVRYMAPEQLENSAAVSASADVYALGTILYEALSGVPAHSGDTIEETMFDILHRDVVRPSRHRELPAELDAAVTRMLERAPARRFSRIEDAARALGPFGALERLQPECRTSADETLSDSESEVRPRPPARRRAQSALALGVACSIGVASGWYARSLQGRPPMPPPAAHALSTLEVTGPVARVPNVASPPPSTVAPTAPVRAASSTSRTSRAGARAAHPAPLPSSHVRAPSAGEAPLPSGFDPKDPYE